VFVVHARAEFQAAEQPGIDQLGEGAVDRGPADAELLLLQVINLLVGVEMVVLAEDVPDHVALLFGVALRPGPAGQVLAELVFRRLRYGNRWQGHGCLLGMATP
jgi:hypothetical protein